jgi:PAS domain S-box-containing protein
VPNIPALLLDAGHDLVLLLGLTYLLSLALPWLLRLSQRPFALALGLAFGGVAVGTALDPIDLPVGATDDLRSVAILAAAVLAGPWSAGVAAVVSAVCSVFTGDWRQGAAVSIAAAMLLGCGFYFLWPRRARAVGPMHYVALGLLQGIANMLASPSVRFFNTDSLAGSLQSTGVLLPSSVVVYPAAVLLVCALIGREIRRIDDQRGLVRSHAGLVERSTELETAVRAYGQEVAERKRGEQALRESEALLRRAQHMAKLGHWTWSPGQEAGTGVTRYSAAAAEVLGIPGSALELSDRAFVERFVHPGDQRRVLADLDRFLSEMAAMSQTGKPPRDHSSDYRIVRPDGEVLTISEIVECVLAEDGSLRYVMGTLQDISERTRIEAALRESEARFRSIADSIPALIWMCDEKGECIFLSKQWSAFTGRTLAEELGHGFLESIHPDDQRHSWEIEQDVLTRRAHAVDEYRLRGKDGTYRWFLDTMVPRFASDGTYLGHVGVLIDIEDRRKLEEQLRRVQRLEAVGQLTGGVAHDFNNLLTVVIGNLDLICAYPDNAKNVAELAALALQAAQRGAELVRRMAAFSRQQTLKPRKIELNRLVAGMNEMLRRTLSANIEIEMKLADGLWTAVADPGQVENSLLNLAINARDAMPEGGRLIIETANVALDAAYADRDTEVAPGDYVLLAVSDTGVGMAPEVLARAVQPFFTTKEVGKGSGLGLSMVYGFAKQSGGHLKIYSEAGHGCTVKLYLPRFVGAAEATADAVRAAPAGSGETILVVEDDELVRHYVVGQLRSLGYDVVEARDGAAALALLAAGRPIDLLFTDVMLPGGLLGPQLLEQARARLPGLRALFTSGYSEANVMPRQLSDNAIRLLQKPYSRQDLAAQIRAALDGATA